MQSPDNPLAPENRPTNQEAPPAWAMDASSLKSGPLTTPPPPQRFPELRRVFIGTGGLRAGWSVLIFYVLFVLFTNVVGFAFVKTHIINQKTPFTAVSAVLQELIAFLGMIGAGAIVALIEGRGILDFNLRGPRRSLHFFSGLAGGFAALSVLVGTLAWGGWLHFGPIALSGAGILKFAALWACAFLVVACVEEGIFRCYLLFTLTRGINFWWALGIISVICIDLAIRSKGNGVWGVYGFALLGLFPCLLLHLNKASGSNFWQATWVSSTLFGFIHTGNNGENWIGIFAAAAIGFVFCVSVRVTGSAWWAIGCHAAWDWAETYFYGTADSGIQPAGHYLTASPAGAVLWSGGTDGPEGSLLVLGVILLLLIALLAIYGRRKAVSFTAAALQQAAG
jgi:uncharacterized protein